MVERPDIQAAIEKLESLLPQEPRMEIWTGRSCETGLFFEVYVYAKEIPEELPTEVDDIRVVYRKGE